MQTIQQIKISRESYLLAALCLLDLIVTVYLLNTGVAIEANPILRYYLAAGILSFVAGKLLLSIVPLVVLEILREKRPRFIRNALRTGIALYAFFYCVGVWKINGG